MLDRSLTYFLTSIAEDGIGAANLIFEQRFGWSVRELRVLRLIEATPGVTFTALASATKFERTLTSRILNRLIRAGLVVRSNSPEDGRVFTLRTTPEGHALCLAAEPLTTTLEGLMMQPLSAAEQASLRDMLSRIRGWVQGGYAEEVAARFPEARGGVAG